MSAAGGVLPSTKGSRWANIVVLVVTALIVAFAANRFVVAERDQKDAEQAHRFVDQAAASLHQDEDRIRVVSRNPTAPFSDVRKYEEMRALDESMVRTAQSMESGDRYYAVYDRVEGTLILLAVGVYAFITFRRLRKRPTGLKG
jgi:hypothetical protein